jgi:hypothetical protein
MKCVVCSNGIAASRYTYDGATAYAFRRRTWCPGTRQAEASEVIYFMRAYIVL